MAKFFNNDPGAFIATTSLFDTQNIQELNINSQEFKSFLVNLQQQLNNVALLLNIKDTGYYSLEEFLCSQAYFPDPSLSSQTAADPVLRQVFRKVINFGGLPNAGTTSVAHGITIDANTCITRLYGAATDPSTTFIPLPYASTTLVNNIELNADATNINITTGIDRTGFTKCFVVIEWIAQ
jgi:hypothetical protein